ncbi:MAG: LysR family transcriptional regulator [Anaerovoracaceae bacterium]
MKLSELKYFVEVAEQQSIRKAAENLYTSQPNLSRAIKSLEEKLGDSLFVRSNHGVTLTKTGQSVYYYAKSILDQV